MQKGLTPHLTTQEERVSHHPVRGSGSARLTAHDGVVSESGPSHTHREFTEENGCPGSDLNKDRTICTHWRTGNPHRFEALIPWPARIRRNAPALGHSTESIGSPCYPCAVPNASLQLNRLEKRPFIESKSNCCNKTIWG
ncbi:uncharacterized protein LOC115270097 [Aedes albopictus]|uniref:Secreted protein n=1 Tax=Aedes albopictus TaxID=7160 RepID=A0ABM1YVK6_AEDAL